MDKMIFVGGLPYSGKTHFCGLLERAHPEKYTHVGLDDHFEDLSVNPEKLMAVLKEANKPLYEEINKFGMREFILGDGNRFKYFASYMIKTNRGEDIQHLISEYSLIHAADEMQKQPKTPVVDGVFLNRDSRVFAYEKIGGRMKTPIADMRKILVYFDRGLDVSLARFKAGRSQNYKSMVCNEKTIQNFFALQEIPGSEEGPNLEVLLIQHEHEVAPAVAHVGQNY